MSRTEGDPLLFQDFAEAVAAIGRAIDPDEKSRIAAAFLRDVRSPGDVVTSARWLAGDRRSSPVPNIPSTIAVRVYATLSGEEITDPATLDHALFAASRVMTGGTIETLRMLLVAKSGRGEQIVRSEQLTLAQVARAFDELARVRETSAKVEMLGELWRVMSPDEIATLHVLAGRGAVARGLSREMLADAIAIAFEQPAALVRHAMAIDEDAGRTALAARRGTLAASYVRPMHLVPPMHAVALERAVDESGTVRLVGDIPGDPRVLLVEERLPGVRTQAHVWYANDGDDHERRVALLTESGRDLATLASSAVDTLRLLPSGTVLDGQLILFDVDGQVIEATAIGRGAARHAVRGGRGAHLETEVVASMYVAFDLLADEGMSMLARTLEHRRRRLEELAERHELVITRARDVLDVDDLERQYADTTARGGLGIVAKDRTSGYEFGERSGAWIKAPGEPESLLAVIRYASRSVEGPDGPTDELTFGVWHIDDDDQARLVNIGRAACAIDDEDLKTFERRLKHLRTQRFGKNYEIEPRIVCEIEYDAIRVSPRTDAGYTIRIARIQRVRWDLGIDAAASVADIEQRHRRVARSRAIEQAVWRPSERHR